MDRIRLSEKNSIQNTIKSTQILLTRNDETIARLETQEKTEFNIVQLKKLGEAKINFESRIKELEQKYENICSGSLDIDLKNKMETDNQIILQKQNEKFLKKTEERKIKAEDRKFNLDKEYATRKEMSIYSINNSIDKYFRDCASIPDHISEKLKNMPNNKGYIWKGIRCFGVKPPDSDTVTLFEKCRGGILKIHEATQYYTCIYEKVGQNKKVLVSKIPRKSGS